MKQIVQSLKTGSTSLVDIPASQAGPTHLTVLAEASLISPGTERMLVQFSRAGYFEKARQQPEKVRQVIEKLRTDGLLATYEAVSSRLDEGLPLGYCHVGKVLEVGRKVESFSVGDRVVSNSPHVELAVAPATLCARIPPEVSNDQAAFTVLGSIALQGIRLANPTLGEGFVVYGLGLIGLLSVQLLSASGCRVFGIDTNADRLALARSFGAQTFDASAGDPLPVVQAWSSGQGSDGVIIAAAAKTDDIVHNSAQMCRKRGRIILVGVVGLNLRREDFYEKELTFQVSSSYGPGRYDKNYEEKGEDYPLGFVRWTARRNFDAVLEMLRTGRLNVSDLITHRVPFEKAPAAYDTILSDSAALGVLLEYTKEPSVPTVVYLNGQQDRRVSPGSSLIGVIGAGNFAKSTVAPALNRISAAVRYVADLKGLAAQQLAAKLGADAATTDYRTILEDEEVRAVIITAGHQVHAQLTCDALEAGKHVLVEKPLALTVDEVRRVVEVARSHPDLMLTVGFNRRFSPHIKRCLEAIQVRGEPLAMNYTVNAGVIPPDHWVHDPETGGGRIVGEACHFIDLMVCLSGSLVERVSAFQMGPGPAVREDKMVIILQFADGSIGTVNYLANGSRTYPKETFEIFGEGRVIRVDNFRKTQAYGYGGFKTVSTFRQDKGHTAQLAAFLDRIRTGGSSLIPLEQLTNVTLASFAAVTSATECRTVRISEEYAAVLS